MGRGLIRAGDWRADLRRRIAVLLAVKLAALIALKVLFFSGDARVTPTSSLLEAQLALPPAIPVSDRGD